MSTSLGIETPVARVGGVPLHEPGEALDAAALRQRACSELLRQAAIEAGLLAADDPAPAGGVMSEAASAAIEALLDRDVPMPTPDEAAARRHYDAHRPRYARGERVLARHVLYAVTPGVEVGALRARAEALLLSLRCADAGGESFAAEAARWSNCPSGAHGGSLGWLTREECAPEFARELFGSAEVGVLPRLVHSRHGLHVVEVLQREPGVTPEFEQVRAEVTASLARQAWTTRLRQVLQQLAGRAELHGIELDAAATPLVQ